MSQPKPKIVVLNSNYPSASNLYGDVFVHSRLQHYQKDFDILVIGYRPFENSNKYEYEGINVQNLDNKPAFIKALKDANPAIIAVHFVGGWYYKAFLKSLTIPVVIWIHGEEALGWYRRLYYFSLGKMQELGKFVVRNIYQLACVRKIISLSNEKKFISFVFVSEWMRKIAETDTLSAIKNYSIVPNPIDTDIFPYREKTVEMSRKILLIRSFETKKYANDVAIKAILLLQDNPIFPKLNFSIYGKGRFFEKLTAPLKGLRNVELHNHFIPHKEISEVHKEHGVFLCPTRQDAQGVSMCEAMSSGLVPISSNNTAIPEFLKHRETGFLTNNAAEVAAAILELVSAPALFQSMSKNAAEDIRSKAGHENVIARELTLLKERLNK